MQTFKEMFLAEKSSSGYIGKIDKSNFAIKLNGVEASSSMSFGDLASMNKVLKTFKEEAKKDTIGAKGVATLAAVKAWVKENNPSEFYAKWTPDSSSYKDDVVEIWYK